MDSDLREPQPPVEEVGNEIVFAIADSARTKAPTPVTSLSSFKVTATTGSSGSETAKFENVTFSSTGSGNTFKGNKMWPATDPSYHFYASNVSMTNDANGQKVTISTIDTDVVCAYLATSTYNSTNTLVFNHILARVGTVSFSNLSSCTDVKLSMKYIGSGTYNLRTGAWSGKGNQQTKQLTEADNNFWIIPGTYTITLTYKDGNGQSQTRTLDQNFLAGKINNITAKLGDGIIVKTETEYEAPSFTLGAISDIPASGGTSGTPSVTNVTQRKRTVNTYASGQVVPEAWTNVSSPSYTVTYSKTSTGSFSSTCPTYTGSNLGTTEKARTKMSNTGDVYVRVTANGKSTDHSAEVYQEANTRTVGDISITYSYPDVASAGGDATPTFSYSQPYSWTSGASGNYTSGATVTWATKTNHTEATLNTSNGKVSWAPNTGTSRSEMEKVTVALYGKTKTAEAVSTQVGDGVSYYDNPTVTLSYSGSPIAYNSTSAISPTLVVMQVVHYTSGRQQELILPASEYSVSYSGSVSGLSVNASTGAVTPTNNTGSAIAARTEYSDITIGTFSYSNIAYTGGSSTPSLAYSQTKTEYTAGRNSTNPRSTTVVASVTAHSKSATGSASVTQNGDAGQAQSSSSTTISSGANVSYSGSATGFTLNASTGKVEAADHTGSGGGVTYGTPSVTFTSSTTSIGYTGGSVTCNNATYSQTVTTAARNSTSERSISVTVTVSNGGKSKTKTVSCTQNGDPGASSSTQTLTTGGTLTYSSSGSGFSNDGRIITATSNAGSDYTDYGDVSISSFTYPDVKAAGGTATPSISYSQSKTSGRRSTSSRQGTITAKVTMPHGEVGNKSITFTQSGDSGTASTSSCSVSVSYSVYSSNAGASLNSSTGVVTWKQYTNTSSNRTITIKATATGEGSKTATKNAVSTQLKKSSWNVDDDDPGSGSGQGGNF